MSSQKKGMKGENKKKGIDPFSTRKNDSYTFTPQQLAVMVALMTQVLHVRAVVLDVDQNVEVVLRGNLKSKEVNTLVKEMNNVPIEKWLSMLQKFQ